MIFLFEYDNDITKRKHLLEWFYPTVESKQNLAFSNKDSKLVKICGKNKHVAELVKRLDLMEV